LWIGGGENKDGMRGRFFQGFEQRVESRFRQHVHFVNDVDFIASLSRCEVDLVAQIADLVDAAIGRCVELDQIEQAPSGDGCADRAGIIGRADGSGSDS
jgi:hypothetical protein